MSAVRKRNEYVGLKEFDVLIEDRSLISTYFSISELPETFPQGKTPFKIYINPKLLKNESEVRVEVIDGNGDVIYTEYPKYMDESGRRLVVLWIYEDDPPGLATIYIVGEATHFENGQTVPEEWRGTYNVRWKHNVMIDPTLPNTAPIIFFDPPNIAVNEVNMPYLEKKFIGNETIVISSIAADEGTTPTGSMSGSDATLLWNTDYRIAYTDSPTTIETTAPTGYTPSFPGIEMKGIADDLFPDTPPAGNVNTDDEVLL
jgi:hypothetical protein